MCGTVKNGVMTAVGATTTRAPQQAQRRQKVSQPSREQSSVETATQLSGTISDTSPPASMINRTRIAVDNARRIGMN